MTDHASKLAFSMALLILTAAQVGCAVNPDSSFDLGVYEPENLTAFDCPDGSTVNVYQVLYENMDRIESSLREYEPMGPGPADWEEPDLIGFRLTETGPEFNFSYSKFLGYEDLMLIDPPLIVVTIWPCSREVGEAFYVYWPWCPECR